MLLAVDPNAPSTSGRSPEHWTTPREGALYSTHVPLSVAQKAAVAVVSAVGASFECGPAYHLSLAIRGTAAASSFCKCSLCSWAQKHATAHADRLCFCSLQEPSKLLYCVVCIRCG